MNLMEHCGPKAASTYVVSELVTLSGAIVKKYFNFLKKNNNMVDEVNFAFPLSSCNQISPWELMKSKIKLPGFPTLSSVFGT